MVTTKQADGVMGMAFVESFSIPAKGKRVLEPGGDHIMLMKLTDVPKAGATVSLVLKTESNGKVGKISMELPVR
jgi:copper(I)-binding protein